MWLAVGVALYARCGRPVARVPLALAGLIILSGTAIITSGALVPEKFLDAVLFNLRLVGGLTIGWLLVPAGISAGLVAVLLVVGATIVALSTFALAAGIGPSYDFYVGMHRFGGMGLAPNEAALVFAGAFNMLPLLFARRPWLALLAPLLVAGILVAGSRTGLLLAAGGSLLWIPAIARSARGARAVVAWLVFLVVAAAFAWITYRIFQGLLAQEVVSPVTERLGDTADVSTVGRLEIYLSTPAYLWQHPLTLLLGVGGSNVAIEWFLHQELALETLHMHDLLLQFLAAYGVTGLLITGFLTVPLVRRRERFPDWEAVGLRWFALTLVAGQVIQYGLFQEKFLLLFTVTIGFVAAATARGPRELRS